MIGLCKTEVIRRGGPWRGFEPVEFSTLEWVDWVNHRRQLEPIGDRGRVLCSNRGVRHGGVTQIHEPPVSPGRFEVLKTKKLSAVEDYLVRVLLQAGISLGFILPLIAIAVLRSPAPKATLKPLFLFIGFLALDFVLMFSFMVVKLVPAWGGWPWQYKLLEVVGIVLLLALVPGFTQKRFGLQLSVRPRSWRVLAICCILYLAISVPLTLWSTHWHLGFNAHLSEYLFEAVLPGVAEEFVYRGLLLSLLNEAFGRPWALGRAPFGWGGIIIIILFAALHGIDVKSIHSIHIYWSALILPGLIGAVLTWLKERSGSVWPGVVFHNFVDLINTIME